MVRIYIVCLVSIITVAVCEEGSCPPTISVDVCNASCGPQQPCASPQKCCPTTCGGSIGVDPMTQRHFVDYIKKGNCPENPRGPWTCTHTCTSDSDCQRSLKCCTNRCGVLTCQQPRFQNITRTP